MTRKLLLLCCAMLTAFAARAVTVSGSEKGILIDTGTAGSFTMAPPHLRMSETDYEGEAPAVAAEGERVVVATYPSGATLRMEVSADGKAVECRFSELPAGAWSFAFRTQIPLKFGQGGHFSFGPGKREPFPAAADRQIIAQSTTTAFEVTDPLGAGFAVTAPLNYQQLQDNRVFNWPVFLWIYNFTFRDHPGKSAFTFRFGEPATPADTAEPPAPAPVSTAISLGLTERGAVIDAGSMGKFTWPVPRLRMEEGDYEGEKASVRMEEDGSLVATYPSGAELRMEVDSGEKTILHSITSPPGSARGFIFAMLVPVKFQGGGEFAFGDGAFIPFPATPERQIVGQATAATFHLVDPLGDGFTLATPMDYQQMQDNRVFNWATFMHYFNFTFASQAGKKDFTVKVTPLAPPRSAEARAGGAKFLVDRFGQSARKDYPEKVESEAELKADPAAEATYLQTLQPGPPLDAYGGLAGSGEVHGLRKTGFFHVAKAGDRWVFVTPEGNAFFQLGVCTIAPLDDYTMVAGREKVYEWLPSIDGEFATAWRKENPGALSFYLVNWIRKHGRPFDQNEWSAQAVERLRRWGFNSGGAWTKPTPAMDEKKFPYALMLPVEFIPGMTKMQGIDRLFDPFAPEARRLVEESFAKRLPEQADNPQILGYFMGNEQLFENVPKLVPGQNAKSPSKQRLVEMLKERYGGDIAAFNKAWEPKENAPSFDALAEAKLLVTTQAAARDMQAFYELFLEEYYSIVHDTLRKYDKNHLLLGSRWQPGTANNETLVRIAAHYNDVISVNYYTYGIEEAFLRRIHEWSGGKPMLLSEWHFSSTDQGLAGGKDVGTQKDRGLAYRNYVETTAALPFVIGSQWFSYVDQSITGRWFEGFNGEGANIGLVNVVDRPYREFLAGAKAANDAVYEIMFGRQAPFVFEDPRFSTKAGGAKKVMSIARAPARLEIDGASDGWPGTPPEPVTSQNTTFGPPDPDFSASTRCAWDDEFLYVLADVKDRTPRMNPKKEGNLWMGDAIELFIGEEDLDTPGGLLLCDRQILIGAGPDPSVHFVGQDPQPEVARVAVTSAVTGDGYSVEVAIPWTTLGIKPERGRELLFDLAVDDSEDGMLRTRQIMWNGSPRNSSDRGAWGRAKLN